MISQRVSAASMRRVVDSEYLWRRVDVGGMLFVGGSKVMAAW